MKRDFDLIRRILSRVEETPAGEITSGFVIEGASSAELGEHVRLLIEAGLVNGEVLRTRGPYIVTIRNLTWKGYDFLDASRDDTIWKLAKEKLLKPAASMTYDILLEWLKTEVRKRLSMGE